MWSLFYFSPEYKNKKNWQCQKEIVFWRSALKKLSYHLTYWKTVMAKTQTFGDKSKKAKDTTIHVKVVKGFRSEKGTTKYVTRFVKVADVAQVDKIDISK